MKGLPRDTRRFSRLCRPVPGGGRPDRTAGDLDHRAGLALDAAPQPPVWEATAQSQGSGTAREEVLEVIGVSIMMGGGPSMVYGVEALEAFDQFAQTRGS